MRALSDPGPYRQSHRQHSAHGQHKAVWPSFIGSTSDGNETRTTLARIKKTQLTLRQAGDCMIPRQCPAAGLGRLKCAGVGRDEDFIK